MNENLGNTNTNTMRRLKNNFFSLDLQEFEMAKI